MNFTLWQDGQEYGPYDLDSVEASIESGDLSPETLARIGEGSDWKPLETLLSELKQPKTRTRAIQKGKSAYPEPSPQARRRRAPSSGAISSEMMHVLFEPTDNLVCKCPECSSDQIQKASVVYSMGVSNHTGSSVGFGYAGIGTDEVTPFVARGRTSGTSISQIASRCAPPTAESDDYKLLHALFWLIGLPLLTLVLLLTVLSSFEDKQNPKGITTRDVVSVCAGLLFVGFLTLVGVSQVSGRKREFEKRNADLLKHLAYWERCWLCHRCGYYGPLR